MTIQLLRRLSEQPLPAQVAKPTDIQALEVLVLAGHARATVPPKVRTLAGHEQPPATVLEITRLGRQALERFRFA